MAADCAGHAPGCHAGYRHGPPDGCLIAHGETVRAVTPTNGTSRRTQVAAAFGLRRDPAGRRPARSGRHYVRSAVPPLRRSERAGEAMGYLLGVDVGTTFTAASLVREDGRPETVALGAHSVAVPSVVHVGSGGTVVGEPAERRATTDPTGVARAFKRRVGDPTPLVLGGERHTAESLMARVVAWVVDTVATTEGGRPDRLALTHPASWGDHRLGRLGAALDRAGVAPDHLVPEPVAAATFYAAEGRVPAGSAVAVYDFGGGTFDAAAVEGANGAFRIVGRPDGLENLGGVDVDHAVLRHVLGAAGAALDDLDPDHPALAAAVAQLHRDCIDAKEALADQAEVTVPVLLPGHPASVVRVSRRDLEAMVRPVIDETVEVLHRVVASVPLTAGALAAVLLVGGSSRLPSVAERVAVDLGLPTVTDAHPKDAVPMGAALAAWAESTAAAVAPCAPPPSTLRRAAAAGRPQPPDGWPEPPSPGPADALAGPGVPVDGPGVPAPAASRSRGWRPAAVAAVLVLVAGVSGAALWRAGGGPGTGDTANGDEHGGEAGGPTPATDGEADGGEAGGPRPTSGDPPSVAASADGAATGEAPAPSAYDPEADGPIADEFDLAGVQLSVAADDWAEQQILGHIAQQALGAAGAEVDNAGAGPGSSFPRERLLDGEVDLYWEYVGSPDGLLVDRAIGRATDDVFAWVREEDANYGLAWLDMTSFDAAPAVLVSDASAERLGLTAVSQIADLVETDPAEATMCSAGTEEGGDLALQGVQATYGLVLPEVTYVGDLGAMYAAVGDGTCTFGLGPGTEGQVAERRLTVLLDDRDHFYPYNAAPRLRAETLEAHPDLAPLFGAIAERLDTRTMSGLVARVELHGETAEDVAADWLAANGFLDGAGGGAG